MPKFALAGMSSDVALETLSYSIGETSIVVERYSNLPGRGLMYFHPHDSEPTSFQTALEMLAHYGGTAVRIRNSSERNVAFVLKGKRYFFDPNRIYSREGIAATLKKYGPYTQEAGDQVYHFALWLSGVLSSDQVFAVHNNRDKGYNVLSYRENGKPAQGVKALYINPKLDPGNFVYTTNVGLFMAAKAANLNTVLQSQDVIDDGSYSVYAMKHKTDYTNVETKNADSTDDAHLMGFVNRYYNVSKIAVSPWPLLKSGDMVDLVATSSMYREKDIALIQKVLAEYGLKSRVIFAKQHDPQGLWYSNTDDMRRKQLLEALNAPDSQAVWGIRGGAGTTNFLPAMIAAPVPKVVKPMIGFSDVTGVHLFLNNKWGWPSIHGVLAEFNREVDSASAAGVNHSTSIRSVIDLLRGRRTAVQYDGLIALNDAAKQLESLDTTLIGGNLTLVATALSTTLQPRARPYTLVLEGIGNNVHQLERTLDQIAYSTIMQHVEAVILGEFLDSEAGDKPAIVKLTDLVLSRFAEKLVVPVFRLDGFGHGTVNKPLPLATRTTIRRNGDGFELTAAAR